MRECNVVTGARVEQLRELVKLLSGGLWEGMYGIHGLLWAAMIELLLCILYKVSWDVL